MDSVNKRIYWADIFKGICIIFVLLYHYDLSITGKTGIFAAAFCVQGFFFISGCMFSNKEYTFTEYAKRQFKSVLVPYFIFSVVNTLFYFAFNRHIGINGAVGILWDFIIAKRNSLICSPMWFLPCLFFVSVFYKLLKTLIKNNLVLFISVFIISAGAKLFFEEPIIFFSINHGLKYLIYFAIGDFIFKYIKDFNFKSFLNIKMQNKIIFTVLFIILSAYVFLIFNQKPIFQPDNLALACLTVFINAVCINAFWVIVSICISRFIPLEKIGQNTLAFCCCESISRTILNTFIILTGLFSLPNSLLAIIIYNFCAMAVTYFVIALPLNKFFPFVLGKKAK